MKKLSSCAIVCGMVKRKAKKKTRERKRVSKEWAIGQPLVFPQRAKPDDAQNALDIGRHAIGQPQQKKSGKVWTRHPKQ
jgi:hypothetical protein